MRNRTPAPTAASRAPVTPRAAATASATEDEIYMPFRGRFGAMQGSITNAFGPNLLALLLLPLQHMITLMILLFVGFVGYFRCMNPASKLACGLRGRAPHACKPSSKYTSPKKYVRTENNRTTTFIVVSTTETTRSALLGEWVAVPFWTHALAIPRAPHPAPPYALTVTLVQPLQPLPVLQARLVRCKLVLHSCILMSCILMSCTSMHVPKSTGDLIDASPANEQVYN